MKKLYLVVSFIFLIFAASFFAAKIQASEKYDPLEDSRIDISLSYLPKNPVNNPSDPKELTVSANVLTSTSSDNIHYTWLVYGSTKESNPTDWEEILKKDLPGASDMSGYGLNELKFRLGLDKNFHFIRVKLQVKEVTKGGNANTRNESIIIPLSSTSDKIFAYSVYVQENNTLIMKDELCGTKTEDGSCLITKGEVIGLKMDSSNLTDFSWKIDGKPLSYVECPLENCNSNEAFFPVLKANQDTYEIEVSANLKKTGKRVTFNQTFLVTEPYAFIKSLDETTCAPIILGYFKDLDDNLTPDYSATKFEAVQGSTVKLDPSFRAQDINNISWTIDVAKITKETAAQYGLVINNENYGVVINDDGTISFPADTEEDYSFDVTFSTVYAPDKLLRKALNKYWGVAMDDFYEKQIDATINITVVSALSSTEKTSSLSENKKDKALASLLSSAPSQLIFLVKIVLISFLLLFSSYFILSLFPKKQ